MTTTTTSALDGYKLDYEDMPRKEIKITDKRQFITKYHVARLYQPIKAYFGYIVEVILK